MTRRTYGGDNYGQSIARDNYRDGQRQSLDSWTNQDWGRGRPDDAPTRTEAERDQ